MASVHAYPQFSTEPIVWDLHDEEDAEEVAGRLLTALMTAETVHVRTTTGWFYVSAGQFAAIAVVA